MDEKMDHALPEGDIKVWKAGVVDVSIYEENLAERFAYIELFVPAKAFRVTQLPCTHRNCARMRKSRVSLATVKSITDKHGKSYTKARSWYRYGFEYEVGKEVFPDAFDDNPHVCCGRGLHVHKHKEDCLIHEILHEERENALKAKEMNKANMSTVHAKDKALKTAAAYNDAVLQILQNQHRIIANQRLDYSKSKSSSKKQ
jgi:hypothetical protein